LRKIVSALLTIVLLLSAASSVVHAETNLAAIRVTNPSGLIPVNLYPAEQYDRNTNYWVGTLNDSFNRIAPLLNADLSYSVDLTGSPYDNNDSGVGAQNRESLLDMEIWVYDLEPDVLAIAYMATHSSELKKQKDQAISSNAYNELKSNLERFQQQIPLYLAKLSIVEQYTQWLQQRSSDELEIYFGRKSNRGNMTLADVTDFASFMERIEILKYNLDVVNRLRLGRDDLPANWVEPADRLVETETSFGYAYCAPTGYPGNYTTQLNPTITYAVKIIAANVEYKVQVVLDGKLVESTYDSVAGIVSAPTNQLSVGLHRAKVYITAPNETIIPGADEKDIPPFPIVEWSFEIMKPSTQQSETTTPETSTTTQPSSGTSTTTQPTTVDKPAPKSSDVSSGTNTLGTSGSGEKKIVKFGSGNKPVIVNNRTLAPVRAFFDGLGAVTKWDSKARTVTSTLSKGKESATITLTIDSNVMTKQYTDSKGNKEWSIMTLDSPATIINGSVYIPIKAAAEAFSYKLEWNAKTGIATLTNSGSLQKMVNSYYPSYKVIGDASKLNNYEREVFALVNGERTDNGLKPLTLNVDLSLLARKKSDDMMRNHYFDHTSPTYGTPFEMMTKAGFNYSAAGENIAWGQRTPEHVMNSWMNSPGHRANILSDHFEQIGIGYAQDGSSRLWTQQFYTPRS